MQGDSRIALSLLPRTMASSYSSPIQVSSSAHTISPACPRRVYVKPLLPVAAKKEYIGLGILFNLRNIRTQEGCLPRL